jgi:hypothetical protein
MGAEVKPALQVIVLVRIINGQQPIPIPRLFTCAPLHLHKPTPTDVRP